MEFDGLTMPVKPKLGAAGWALVDLLAGHAQIGLFLRSFTHSPRLLGVLVPFLLRFLEFSQMFVYCRACAKGFIWPCCVVTAARAHHDQAQFSFCFRSFARSFADAVGPIIPRHNPAVLAHSYSVPRPHLCCSWLAVVFAKGHGFCPILPPVHNAPRIISR
ncbi:hypothetical protein BCR44DRAFT_1445487 [Catenaria anguillulae PL171]|uniref:Uncharacterized protein n=1 Tax=Catenaria anguillulae PL171 TaxID=765915 RepID=A0A1Y2H6Z5_9FUNG|nr:hypothetical protein BCR44DRAFT_1445487 [Catenaria anguillulae PL171]